MDDSVPKGRPMANVSDQALEAKPPPGATRDLTAWMSAYGPGLRRFFKRRANPSDVDDLVQDVFVRLHSAQLREPIENVEGYLFTVARHVLVSRHRAEAARGWPQGGGLENAADLSDELSPERITAARQDYARAIQAILNLPPRARAAFQFHRFENMTYGAIAKRMGISKESVKELMHRAIVRIAEQLEQDR